MISSPKPRISPILAPERDSQTIELPVIVGNEARKETSPPRLKEIFFSSGPLLLEQLEMFLRILETKENQKGTALEAVCLSPLGVLRTRSHHGWLGIAAIHLLINLLILEGFCSSLRGGISRFFGEIFFNYVRLILGEVVEKFSANCLVVECVLWNDKLLRIICFVRSNMGIQWSWITYPLQLFSVIKRGLLFYGNVVVPKSN